MTFVSHCIAMPEKAHTTHLSGYRPSLEPKTKGSNYPRRACAARVIRTAARVYTVVGSVCIYVCYSTSYFPNVLSSHKRYDLRFCNCHAPPGHGGLQRACASGVNLLVPRTACKVRYGSKSTFTASVLNLSVL